MRIEWVVTAEEQRRFYRTAWVRSWVRALPLIALMTGAFVVFAGGPVTDRVVTAVAMLAMFVLIAVFQLGRVRRSVQVSFPVGFVASTEPVGATLRLTSGVGVGEMPLDRFTPLAVRPGGVRMVDSVTRARCWYPRPLFPDQVLARMGAGAAAAPDAPMAVVPDVPAPSAAGVERRTWQVTRSTRAAVVRGRFRAQVLILPVWLAAAGSLVLLATELAGGDDAVFPAVLVVAWVIFLAQRFVRLGAAERRRYPDGYVAVAEYAEGRVHLHTAVGSSDLALSELTRPKVVGAVVRVRLRGFGTRVTLPRVLVPDEALRAMPPS